MNRIIHSHEVQNSLPLESVDIGRELRENTERFLSRGLTLIRDPGRSLARLLTDPSIQPIPGRTASDPPDDLPPTALRIPMPDQPDDHFHTSQTLMRNIRHAAGAARNEAWSLFTNRYAPIIRGYARRQGLANTDVDDLIQETFTALLNFEYDPAKGRFRGYLKTCVINSIRRLRAKNQQLPTDPQPAADVAQAQPDPFDQFWEAEQLRYAMELVRDHYLRHGDAKTYRAFDMQTIQELPPQRIAEELNITVESVYQAKSRVLSRLRKMLEAIEEQDG